MMVRTRGKDIFSTVVFRQGENGCHTYRIPSLVQGPGGALIAMAEARRDNWKDPGGGHIDICFKLSRDGGRSWSDRRFLERSPEGWSASNPTAVPADVSGRVFVLFNRWRPGRGGGNSRPGTDDNQLWLRTSDDSGESWSEPVDITRQGRDFELSSKSVFGPGHGILTTGGRLAVPANAPVAPDDDSPTASFVLYSDDMGATWNRGRQLNAYSDENQVVELDDGRLMMDARQKEDAVARWTSFSRDAGETWSEPEPGQIAPRICASVAMHRKERRPGVLLWSGIKGPERNNLVLRLSRDSGKTFPFELSTAPGPAGYSDMVVLRDGSVGILHEGGEENYREKISFTLISAGLIEFPPC